MRVQMKIRGGRGEPLSGGEPESEPDLASLSAKVMAALPPEDVPLGDASTRLAGTVQPELVGLYWSLPSVKKLFGAGDFITVVARLRQSPLEIEQRAAQLMEDPDAFALTQGLKYQDRNKGWPAFAMLDSPEVLAALKAFVKRPGGLEFWQAKRTGQALAIFLASRKGREVALELMPQIRLGTHTVLTADTHALRAYWYYLPAVHAELKQHEPSPTRRGQLLFRLAEEYEQLPDSVTCTDPGANWREWIDESKYLKDRIADYTIRELTQIVLRISDQYEDRR
jgi:hypothetical protein